MPVSTLASAIIRGETSAGSWSCVRAKPHPTLRRHVYDYQGYASSLRHSVRRRQLPVFYIPLIINFGAPFRVVDRASGEGHQRRSFLAGLHTRYVHVDSTSDELCLHVDLTPLGACRLLGMPMHELADRTVDLSDLPHPALRVLAERLGSARGWATRFAILDRFLRARLDGWHDDSGVAWAWRQLRSTQGTARVADIARELGWSHKRLGNRFRERIGVTPKRAARLVRFNHALRRHQTGACPADIAAACGYVDQAHMIHEFRSFAGMTPQALMAAEIALDSGVHDA